VQVISTEHYLIRIIVEQWSRVSRFLAALPFPYKDFHSAGNFFKSLFE
jgi:hypothetical protein